MKITDGKRTVEITIHRWNGSGYDPDQSLDYFGAGCLPYDEETDTYTVEDVDYCIDIAQNGGEDEGARWVINSDGEAVIDPNVVVDVTDV
mgnify:CR=1 FL=1